MKKKKNVTLQYHLENRFELGLCCCFSTISQLCTTAVPAGKVTQLERCWCCFSSLNVLVSSLLSSLSMSEVWMKKKKLKNKLDNRNQVWDTYKNIYLNLIWQIDKTFIILWSDCSLLIPFPLFTFAICSWFLSPKFCLIQRKKKRYVVLCQIIERLLTLFMCPKFSLFA